MADAIDRIIGCGATLYAVEDSIDIQTDTGQMLAKLLIMVAEWERSKRRRDFSDAGERAVLDLGIHPAARPNTGYRRGPDRRLDPHPIYGPLVTDLFDQAANGRPWVELASFLMHNGVPTAWGNANWTGRSVKEMLRNEVYLGVAYKGQWRNPDAHPPLTDRETFMRAQRRKTAPGSVSTGHTGLLAGLVRCAGCRYVMRADPPARPGFEKRRLSCSKRHSAGTCQAAASCDHARLEELVVERFFVAAGDLRASASDTDQRRQELQLELSHLRDLLVGWAEPSVQAAVSPGVWTAGLQQRQSAVDRAERDLLAMPQAPVRDECSLRSEWPRMTVSQRRLLLHATFDAVFVRKASRPGRHAEPLEQRLHFCMSGEAPDDMPRRGQKSNRVLRSFQFDDPR